MLEACVHTSANDVPPSYTLLNIAVEDGVAIEVLDADVLPENWTKRLEVTRAIGSEWLRRRTSALLRVPSILVPATWNVLLNPEHGDAPRVRVEAVMEYPFDGRLKR